MSDSATWSYIGDQPFELRGLGVTISEQIFGALSQASDNPLSRVAVANSCFSLDPFRGCPGRCAYCAAGGAVRDLRLIAPSSSDEWKVQPILEPELLFSGEELAYALIHHPAFIRHKSVIGACTSSTDPFLPEVEEHVWRIMWTTAEEGCRNPFWIVTKLGISDRLVLTWAKRISLLREAGITVIISVTHSASPRWVEPNDHDRFRNISVLKQAGAKIAHHLRPIIPGVNDSKMCASTALDASLGIAEAICVGGLRTDPGVELMWHHIHGLDTKFLPPRGREKTLPDGYVAMIESLVRQRGFHTRVATRSAEAICHILDIADYTLHEYRSKMAGNLLRVPSEVQYAIEKSLGWPLPTMIDEIANRIGLEAVSTYRIGDEILTRRELVYQERTLLIHAIGHSGIMSLDTWHD